MGCDCSNIKKDRALSAEAGASGRATLKQQRRESKGKRVISSQYILCSFYISSNIIHE